MVSQSLEEILSLLWKDGKIEIEEIPNRLGITKETANTAVHFLMRFGFVELNQGKRYIRLSEACKKFFKETG